MIQAQAEFSLDKDYCFLSTTFEFQSQNTQVMGVFQMAYSNPPVSLPIMNISFSGEFKPNDVTISWKSAKLTNKNNQALFDQAFTKELNSSQRDFPFYRNGGEVYYSPAYGFLNSRIFMAMFLSQNNMELNFTDQSGKSVQILIPLSGSDQTFRNMAIECYKDRAFEYLNEHTTRKKGLSESWSTAYGLLDYSIASNLQETNYVLKEEYKTDIAKSYDFYANLYPLLQEKSQILEKIFEAEDQSTVTETLNVIKDTVASIESKQARMNELKFSDREGLIQSTKEEAIRLQEALYELENQIHEIKDNRIKESESSLDDLRESNAILVSELEVLNKDIAELEEKISSSAVSLQRLYEAYTYVGAKIKESDLKRVQEMKYTGPPLSIEAIQEQMNKVSNLEMDILFLEMSLEKLKELEPVLKSSMTQYQNAMSSYREQLLTQKEITSLKFKIQQLQVIKRKKEEEVGISIQRLKATNKVLESNIAKERSLEDEKSSIINQLKVVNGDFDNLLEQIESQGLVVLPQIMCRSNIFRADVNDYCLTAQDLESDAEISYFFENMSSSRIDNIIVRSQMDYSYPWRNAADKNKVQTLTEKLNLELKSEEFKRLNKIWDQILTYRWRYNQVRNLKADFITAKTYEDFVKAMQAELSGMDRDISDQVTELKKLESQLQKQKDSYLKNEVLYNTAIDGFSDKFLQIFGSAEGLSDLDSCLRDLFDITGCQNQFGSYLLTKEQERNQKLSEYQTDIEGLMLVVSSGIHDASEFKKESENKLATVREQKDMFLQTSKLEELLQEQDNLNIAYLKLLEDLRILEERKEGIESEKAAKILEVERFTRELGVLQSETEALKAKLAGLSSGLEAYCTEQGHLYENMSQINQRIVDMGGVIQEALGFVSPCQTIKNMVLR